MLLIWSGWGVLTVPIVAGTSIVVGGILGALLNAMGLPQLMFLAISLGLFAAAAANWYVGKRLNGVPARELVDAATGQRVLLTRSHKLFWIKMEYWSIPVAVAALIPLLALPAALAR